MEDFNCVADINLDRKTNQKKKQGKPNPLLNWFKRQEFKDVYRTINPDLREYSWSRGDSESRIDYIWITEELSEGLYEAEIQEMDVCTSSDHGAVVAMMELGHLMSPYSAAKALKRKYERTVYLYNEATKED